MKRIHTFLMIVALLLSNQLQAKTLAPESVPEPLQPWTDWVLQGESDYGCPFLYNSFEQKRCAWPSRLILNLNDQSADFSLHWKVFAESWVQLPGDTRYWPLNVAVNQKAAVVTERQGKPAIKLPPGNFKVSGRFFWNSIPDNLQIPADTGLISVNIRGKGIETPTIKRGQLWLNGGDIKPNTAQSIQDKLDLQVFRRIDDDVPLQMVTRLELQVAGEQREIKLLLPMLENFIPMRLQSSLPARIEPDGSLLLQLRPGSWQIDLITRHVEQVSQLSFHSRDKNWPALEIWTFAARPHLRLVEIENASAIGSQLTNLPDAWKKLPAYRMKNGDTMRFKVIRRGDPDPEPDKLTLERRLWLDFDGSGYSVHDKISGRMTHSWRLNASPRTQLGKASLDGKNQLITRLSGSKKEGIEVRKGQINLSADSRIPGPVNQVDALGWEQNFHQVRALLNLPPGWRLIGATGIDNVPDSWISSWTLLDLFLVLIASLAIGRLWNFYWGAFALVVLALIWHEAEAPRFVWLNILAALALLRVLPPGRLYRLIKFYRNASWLALLLLLIPFMVSQVRTGLYPQLEMPWRSIGPSMTQSVGQVSKMVASPQAVEEKEMRRSVAKGRSMDDSIRPQSMVPDRQSNYNRIDPKAHVQTGLGLPQWQWVEVDLSWNGSVDAAQQMRFWYLTPGMTKLLNFLRALLVAVLALLLLGVLKGQFKFGLNNVLPGLLMLPLLSIPVQEAHADFPDRALLDELKSRLLRAPDCLPSCAQIPQIQLSINPQQMDIKLQVELQQRVAVPLPGKVKQWLPRSVSIDGKIAEALYRDRDGVLWINLEPGKHTLLLQGIAPPRNQFFLPLPLNPHHVTTTVEGWLIEGLHENRSPGGQLQFTRQRGDGGRDGESALESGVLPTFVQVERTLQLGLDWQVETRVIRVTPPGTAIVLKIPLLDTESVTTAGIRVENGKVLVNMSANQRVMHWRSVLDKTAEIKLAAAQTDQWTEVWRADISPIWHMQNDGIAVVHHQDKQGRWLPEWRPWPGEMVVLSISRPNAVAGQTLTIDKSQLETTPGKRSREVALHVTLRSSQATQHIFTLPMHAVLQSVSIDQRSQPIRQQGQQITLPIRPGSQNIAILWREMKPIATLLTTPDLNLGIESVNTTLNVNLGQDRWILLTYGPAFGPAVLFWGVLLVISLIAYALGRISITPLNHWHWLLLLIGLSQIPVEAALLVVAWLIILGYRGKTSLPNRAYFNALQIAIALLTVISLGLLFFAINQGLLGSPEMQISGNQSTAYRLNWYQDRSAPILPQATLISIPLTVYRLLMLAWSLWLAVSLLNWLKWGWSCFSSGGLWIKGKAKKISVANAQTEEKN